MNEQLGECYEMEWRKQVAALTKERDEAQDQWRVCNAHVVVANAATLQAQNAAIDLLKQLASSQAREAQLREEVYVRSGYSRETLDKLFPTDDTALQQRLAVEKDKRIEQLAIALQDNGYVASADFVRSMK